MLGEALLLLLAISFTVTMSTLLAVIKVGQLIIVVMVLMLTMFILIFGKSFIRSKPPGRRLVTSDIHLLQVSPNDC